MFELDWTHAWLPIGGAVIISAFTLGAYSTLAAIAHVPLKLTGDEEVPPVIAGNLYVNVHTAANPLGEIRGQLMPR